MKILSLGAGVQSSTIWLMSCRGLIERLDAAIFADTGWEPAVVYKWFEFLKEEGEKAGIPIHIVSQGNIKEDAYRSQVPGGDKKKGERHASMPLFTKKVWVPAEIPLLEELIEEARAAEKDKTVARYEDILLKVQDYGSYTQNGMFRRQCTYEYKIRPIERETRRLLGYAPRKRIPVGSVETWKGISTDESQRVTISDKKWLSFYYPLIDMGMSRQDCLDWFKDQGLLRPPRSSCIGCPFHSDDEWRFQRDTAPEEWQESVNLDLAIRKCGGMLGDVYMHAKRIPLGEVDLLTAEDCGQLNLFGDFREECQGVCGV